MFPFFSFRFIQLVWRSIFSLPQNPAHPYNVTLVSNIKILPPYFPGCIPCLTLKPLCPRSIYYVLCFPRGNPTNRVISTRSFFIIDLPTNNQENRDWLEHWILARVSQYGSGVRLCSSWHGGGLQEPPLVSHILPRGFPTHSCTKSLYQSITHIIGHKLKFLFHTTKKTQDRHRASVASEHNHSVLDRSTGTKEQTIPLYFSFWGGWCGEVGTWWLPAKSAPPPAAPDKSERRRTRQQLRSSVSLWSQIQVASDQVSLQFKVGKVVKVFKVVMLVKVGKVVKSSKSRNKSKHLKLFPVAACKWQGQWY